MGQKRTATQAGLQVQSYGSGKQQIKANAGYRTGAIPKERHVGKKSGLILKPRSDWHATPLADIAGIDTESTQSKPAPGENLIRSLRDQAEALLEAENEVAAKMKHQDASQKFMTQIMATGTLEDKVSALTLAVQESPLHHKKMLDSLLTIAKKKSRNHALMSLAAIKDVLCQGNVLPSDRKLRYFEKQPGVIAALQAKPDWFKGQPLPGGLQDSHLLVWAYEDFLKHAYFDMIRILEGWCNDEIEFSRTRALGFVYELLKDKPEQEDNLLRLLVNKLGDKTKRVASRASFLLLQLEQAHPNMKDTIIRALQSDILFRPGQDKLAKYYAILTLNQTVLSSKDPALSQLILDMYFRLFRALLSEDKEQQSSRRDKSSKSKTNKTTSHPPSINIGNNGKKLNRKALQRLQDTEEFLQVQQDMREKLIAQILTGINRAFPFTDLSTSCFDAQLEALYRIAHSSNFNTAIQSMILIQMITESNSIGADRYYRTLYESLLDPRLLTSKQQIMYLNLLYKSLKSDWSIKRVQAFVKRILHIIPLHEPPFACSALYLISEIIKTFPSIETMLSTPMASDEDEQDSHEDVHVHAHDIARDRKSPQRAQALSRVAYDAHKRDPQHANAHRSCLWELSLSAVHFHPSVALFATQMLEGGQSPPKPDPSLHTLIHFLDRFVYRNAKASGPTMRGSSIMQPLAGTEGADLLVGSRSGASSEAALNTEAFWSKKLDNVLVDQVFFHQYFSKEMKSKSQKKNKKAKSDDLDDVDRDVTGTGSDADEDEIWDAMINSRSDMQGDVDEDDFSEMDEMEELMEDDDSNLPDDQEDGGVELNIDSDTEDEQSKQEFSSDDQGALDSGMAKEMDFSIADLESDDDALLDSDDEITMPLHAHGKAQDKNRQNSKDKMTKGKKLKHLPLFASVDDYAALLDQEEEDED